MKRVCFFISVLSILCMPLNANAQDSFWADDSSPEGKVGLVWYEDVIRSGNGISAIYAGDIGAPPSYICSSTLEIQCKNYSRIYAEIMLPPCSVVQTEFCIDELMIGNSKKLDKANLERLVIGEQTPADSKMNLPVGSSTSIWTATNWNHSGNSNRYAVGVRLRFSGDSKSLDLSDFQASVVPFREVSGNTFRDMKLKEIMNQGEKSIARYWHVGNCIWQELGKCGIATRWFDEAIVSLKLRVPSNVTGWLNGRLKNPSITVKNLSKTVNEITVLASPVSVQGSAPKIDVEKITPSLMKLLTDNGKNKFDTRGGYVWQLEPNDENFNWFEEWYPLTNNVADGISDYWNFKSIGENFSTPIEKKCLSSKEKLIGLVTTNSLWYSSKPPIFIDSKLDFKVAGLHFNQDGITPFLGSYNLVIDSSAARCLYGFNKAPISASISVLNSNGNNNVSTQTVSEKNGWLSLSANGFTFSNQTISTKLFQLKTIKCKKGKLIRTLTAKNPSCPVGYLLKR